MIQLQQRSFTVCRGCCALPRREGGCTRGLWVVSRSSCETGEAAARRTAGRARNTKHTRETALLREGGLGAEGQLRLTESVWGVALIWKKLGLQIRQLNLNSNSLPVRFLGTTCLTPSSSFVWCRHLGPLLTVAYALSSCMPLAVSQYKNYIERKWVKN